MNAQQERRIGELTEDILQLADRLPWYGSGLPDNDLETIEELDSTAENLWNLWREVQVEKDLAACL